MWDGKPSLQLASKSEGGEGKRIPKDLALGHPKGLVFFSNSYHPALNLKLSCDLDNKEKREGKEPRLGKECREDKQENDLPSEAAQKKAAEQYRCAPPPTVLDRNLLKREESGCQLWAWRSYLQPQRKC